jgi:hypothetical protein
MTSKTGENHRLPSTHVCACKCGLILFCSAEYPRGMRADLLA